MFNFVREKFCGIHKYNMSCGKQSYLCFILIMLIIKLGENMNSAFIASSKTSSVFLYMAYRSPLILCYNTKFLKILPSDDKNKHT